MADFSETIKLTIDDLEYTAAITARNKDLTNLERQTLLSNKNMGESFDNLSKKILSSKQASQSAINNTARQSELRAVFSGNDEAAKIAARTKLALFSVRGDAEATNRILAAGKQELANFAAAAEKSASAIGGLFNQNSASGRGFLALKDLFEGRTSYAQVEGLTALSKVGNLATLAIVGTASAIAGLGIASIASLRSVAQFGIEQKKLQESTGLSAHELGAFGFAAKVTGENVDVVQKLMRGLTQAVTDNSASGQKARDTLHGLGVDFVDANGKIRPVGDLLLQISAGFGKLAPGTTQAKDAMELFKRSGIDATDFLKELKPLTEYFNTHGFASPDQKALDNFDAYGKVLATSETKLSNFLLKFKAVLAVGGAGIIEGFGLLGGRSTEGISGVLDPAIEAARQRTARINLASQGGTGAQSAAQQRLSGYLTSTDTLQQANDKVETLAKNYADARSEAAALLGSQSALPSVIDSAVSKARNLNGELASAREEQRKSEAQQSAQLSLDKKGVDDLLTAQQKLANLKEGIANKDLAFGGQSTNAQKEAARFAAQVSEQVAATGYSEAAVKNKLGEAHGTLLQAALIEDNNIRRKYFIDETEYESEIHRQEAEKRFQEDVEFAQKLHELRTATTKSGIQFGETLAQESRDRQIRAIENTDAKTLQAKVAYIVQAGNVEADFAKQSEAVKLEALQFDTNEAIKYYKAQFDARQITATQFGDFIKAKYAEQAQAELQIGITTADAIAAHTEQAQIKAQEAVRDAYTHTFDSIKSGLSRLFDSLGSKGGFGKFIKTSLLDAVKEIGSTQGARLLTEAATGKHVDLVGSTPATTGFGKFLQLFGFGTKPSFGNINLPNHIGDVALTPVNGVNAVPVYVANHADIGGGSVNISGGGGRSGGFLPAGLLSRGSPIAATVALALGLGGGTATASAPREVTSSVFLTGGEPSSGLGGGFFSGGGANATPELAVVNGGVTGDVASLPGFGSFKSSNPFSVANLSGGGGGSAGSGLAGILGKSSLGALIKGGLPGLKNAVFNSSVAAQTNFGNGGLASTAAGVFTSPLAGAIGASLLGLSTVNVHGAPVRSGVQAGVGGALFGGASLGGLASKLPGIGGAEGGALLGVGGGLLLNGLQRGGVGGLFEDIGGGAAIGLKFGGPIGAAIGAGAGAIAGGIRSLFKTATQTAQSKVQSIYGVKISDQALLGQLVQLSNSQFSGNITTAVTSPQGRQLIQLYAQSTGQKATGILATPQAAQFANQGGVLSSIPTYFNGQPVYPGQTQTTIGNPVISPGGIPLGFTPVGTGANASGAAQVQSISLDGDATTAFLQGQAVQTMQNNPRVVSSAASAGQTESATQRYSAVNTLAPAQLLS